MKQVSPINTTTAASIKPEWKAMLKRLRLDHIKAKSPGFFELSGGYDMKVKPWNDNTANGLTAAIIDFIIFSGGDANRINSQGQMRKINGEMKWTHGGTRRGTADIHAIMQGRHISVEVKTGADKQREDQKKEMERIRRAGGIYWLADSFPSFLEQWIAAGFELPAEPLLLKKAQPIKK